MKPFFEPELSVELFRVDDVVTASTPTNVDPEPDINGTPIG